MKLSSTAGMQGIGWAQETFVGKASEAISSGLQDAEAEAQSMIDEARADANKEADSVSADGQTALAAIHEQGKKNRSSAVDSVLDAFLES